MKRLIAIVAVIAAAVAVISFQPKSHFDMRGIIVNTHDLSTVDWGKLAAENGINTVGTHMFPGEVIEFIESEKGQAFLASCKKHGVEVEHQLHSMAELLPRELFAEDSTMFRMDENGRRVADANCCVHSERALATIAENVVKVAKILTPTNHRYYFWLDDGKPVCQCEKCKQYTESEQALIIENRMIKALREFDPEAQLAHLAYYNSLKAPRKVKPEEGIFLEFAPFLRSWEKPLADLTVEDRGMSHAQNMAHLKENLEVFPAETAVVLEYWLDVSLFSSWKKPAVQLPWRKDVFLSDINTYAELGIKNITSFGVYMDSAYFEAYPDTTPLKEYGEGLANYRLNSK
ncbi:MAG: DUF4838 domain-containing protein [Alistipes sp.]|nr:DUF4838 domain-containing protein [Alistipes sp.]